ncbi:diguanylate cyclase (GGDEF) domain-containing protein [Lachnospiraceae bacterium RM5]|nr:diguanylate cyclase (GGDEF) domain-containing protein [Lachnospiraceae bacterium RM5]
MRSYFRKIEKHMIFNFIIIAIICFLYLFVAKQESNVQNIYIAKSISLNNGWQDKDGNEISLDKLPKGEITVTKHVGDINFSNCRFCSKTKATVFKVYADGKLIYEYNPKFNKLYGKSYGTYIHSISIPNHTSILKLEITPLFTMESAIFYDACVGDSMEFTVNIFREGLGGFILCIITLVIGLLMIISGYYKDNPTGFVYLGEFAVLIALWSLSDTLYFQLITTKPELIRFINYITLMLTPYAPVAFITEVTKNKKKNIFNYFFTAAITLNFLVTIILVYCTKYDYRDLVYITHVTIILSAITCTVLVILAKKRKSINPALLNSITIGIICLAICTAIDMIRFILRLNTMQNTSIFTRFGIFIFLCEVGMYMIQDYRKAAMEKNKAEIMKALAYTDALTGINNRLAFSQKENELKKKSDNCAIIQLDINNQKTVNDNYGHDAGDKHIITAAKSIEKSFKSVGTCYRTGGDEFITVIDTGISNTQVDMAIEKLQNLIQEYNSTEPLPPVPLSIAYGIAWCDDSSKDLDTAEKTADKKMYEMKKSMKKEAR